MPSLPTIRESSKARGAAAQESTETRERSVVTFGTGVLTGAAVSSVVPWHTLEGIAPSLRIGALAGVCAGFVLFRVVLRSKAMRRTGGLLCVMTGGFLMSSGQHVGSAQLTSVLVAIGAGAFLCGITLLLRDRLPTRESREEAIQRLLEDADGKEIIPAEPAALGRLEAMNENDSGRDLANLAKGVGIRAPLNAAECNSPAARAVSNG